MAAGGLSVRSNGTMECSERGEIMRMARFIGLFAMGLSLMVGCGKNTDTNTTVQEGGSTGSIIVHVSDGSTTSQPVYSWEIGTDTSADQITVARKSDLNTIVWGIQSAPPLTDKIQSPWQHGTVGGSVTTISTTEDKLQSQIEYQVKITKADNSFGTRNFTIIK
jgi:hypothetical protein